MLLPVLPIDTCITDVSARLTALQMKDVGKQWFVRKHRGLEEEDGRSSENSEGVSEEERRGDRNESDTFYHLTWLQRGAGSESDRWNG